MHLAATLQEAPHYTLRVPLPLAAPPRARINNHNRYTRFDDPATTTK
jgi:hypothetical protein